jgi:hypothetical protein
LLESFTNVISSISPSKDKNLSLKRLTIICKICIADHMYKLW